MKHPSSGISAALAAALFMGLTPIFGKQAILLGFAPQMVVALRTSLASALLLLIFLLFNRRAFYIYPAGLLGCILAGSVNGLGSLFFYAALVRLDAGKGQLIFSLYPLFVALWARLDRQPLPRLTLYRMLMALPAIILLSAPAAGGLDLPGAGLMLAASALYALHLPINQKVLYDMPAPTVTLYTLMAMNMVVGPVYLFSHPAPAPPIDGAALPAYGALLGLTLATFFARLSLFAGVKRLGGVQTALLGLAELFVTLLASAIFLGERFTPAQWLGVLLLAASLSLVLAEQRTPAAAPPSSERELQLLRRS